MAILGPAIFLGRVPGGPVHCMATATTIAPTTVSSLRNTKMIRVLHEEQRVLRPLHRVYAGAKRSSRGGPDRPALQFQRETGWRAPADARALWRARPSSKGASQSNRKDAGGDDGATRSRVNYFMNKFRKLGSSNTTARSTSTNSLLSVVLERLS